MLGAGLVMLACGLLLLARIGPSGSALGFVLLPGILVARRGLDPLLSQATISSARWSNFGRKFSACKTLPSRIISLTSAAVR